MSRCGTGFSCDFETDAACIRARWKLRLSQLDQANMGRAAFSGLDLYALDRGVWKWAGAAFRHQNRNANEWLVEGMAPAKRRFRIYFPLRNPVIRMEIGVPPGAKFIPIPPRKTKPIVYYGSSIVHGAYASRAGVVHPSVLGRQLNRPVINLGFSGQAKMHEGMGQLLAELDAGAFIIDPLPNMDKELVAERAEGFLRTLCEKRRAVPVVMVEDFPLTNAWIRAGEMKKHRAKWKAYAKVFKKLRREGFSNLHYVEGLHSIGDDHMGTVDGIHPNDTGYERLAKNLFPALKRIL
jgi:phenylpyruvate tautomerase PptA (4-oxalocrotonate tautomerase family)